MTPRPGRFHGSACGNIAVRRRKRAVRAPSTCVDEPGHASVATGTRDAVRDETDFIRQEMAMRRTIGSFRVWNMSTGMVPAVCFAVIWSVLGAGTGSAQEPKSDLFTRL